MITRARNWVSSQFAWIMLLIAIGTASPANANANGFDADPSPSPSTSAKSAIQSVAPIVPPEVVVALQQGDYQTARKALITLAEKTKDRDELSYYAYLRAIAERLAGQRDAARETLNTSLKANPAGHWAAKIRLELANIELAAGNWAAAEELARAEAVRLLAGPRKDQLAGVYSIFAEKMLDPGDPLVPRRPQRGLRAFGPGTRARREPGAARPTPVHHGSSQPDRTKPRPRDCELPALSEGLSRRR